MQDMNKVLFWIVGFGMFFQTSFVNAGGTSIGKDMKKLVNYNRMLPKHYKVYEKQRQSQYNSWKENNIPKNFQIPVSLQSFRDNNSARYYVIYNPAYKTGVGYVPSNLTQYYEEEAWRAYQELGRDAPSLSIVLAQQFTESAFNPWATGDNNMSNGLPQLYRKTAEFLYKTDKETWKQLFYFDKHGKHHFKDVRSMVRFPFIFLPKVKEYNFENKFEGIRKYNGAGENAIKYAEKVMRRSLFYEELFAENNTIPLDTAGFKQNLFGMINLTLLARDEEPIDDELMAQIFSNAIAEFYSGYVRNTYLQHYLVPVYESQPIIASSEVENKVPVDGKDYYIIVEDGRVIYTYFNDAAILLQVINHPKNKDYYLYYIENKKRVKISSYKKIGKKQIYSNVKPGDKVYIPPGTILLSPETNLAVRIN
jgi:hypothetical protein